MTFLVRTIAVLWMALVARAAICPSSPTCSRDDKCTFSTNGATFEVNCATDRYGGDLVLTQASSLTTCIRTCSLTDGCLAVSYVGENCYLKNTTNSGSSNPNVIAAHLLARATPSAASNPNPTSQQSCPVSFSCPESNGCAYKGSSSGRGFTVMCGTDFYGGDFFVTQSSDLASCAQVCAADAGCLAVSFVGGKGSGSCYLKSQYLGRVINERVDGMYLDTRIATSPSSTTNSAKSSSSPSPAPTQTTQAIKDTGFESGANPYIQNMFGPSTPSDSPWTVTAAGAINPYDASQIGLVANNAHTGTYSWGAQGTDATNTWRAGVAQSVTVVPGKTYTLEFWAKQAAEGNCFVQAIWSNWNNVVVRFTPSTTWTKGTASIAVGDSTSGFIGVELYCSKGTSAYKAWLDDITMTAVL